MDIVRLTPFAKASRTKRQDAEKLTNADFLVSEASCGQAVPRFHIELKAGPGAIDEMSEFQLDVNDYNDIVGPVRNTGLPAYVFHVQLGTEYLPPTRRSVARRIWWTDLATLMRHFNRRAQRRDESKAAFYFDPKAFRPAEEFGAHLKRRGFEEVRNALLSDPPELAG